ncbi:MAG: DUF6051 family protein [Ignavibacteria bacterium]|nr:DUF6051 family protein [Ignavibacteria bacterium]
MGYLEDYYTLKDTYTETQSIINIPDSNILIKNFSFHSNDNEYFPEEKYFEDIFKKESSHPDINFEEKSTGEVLKFISQNNKGIICNTDFIYPVYTYEKDSKFSKVTILLHGLNESSWDKYHTWAKRLVELTCNPVILFPISFHINRRPKFWIDSRKMNTLSKDRKMIFDGLKETSFVNAAISTRLQFATELFFWSGLRTYHDILNLINLIKCGQFDFIKEGSEINFFGYSIGAFLIEILLMSNYELFKDSGTVLFCGGPTVDLMYPASKYIYDTETAESITSFYVNDFEEAIKRDNYLSNFFANFPEGSLAYRSMLNFNRFKDNRETFLKRIRNNILAVCLTKDEVMPPASVKKVLSGNNNEPGIEVRELDFPFDYDHVSPFPLSENIRTETNRYFKEFMDICAGKLI